MPTDGWSGGGGDRWGLAAMTRHTRLITYFTLLYYWGIIAQFELPASPYCKS